MEGRQKIFFRPISDAQKCVVSLIIGRIAYRERAFKSAPSQELHV